VTEDEVVPFFHGKGRDIQKATQDALKREQWKEHRLYGERKDNLLVCARRETWNLLV